MSLQNRVSRFPIGPLKMIVNNTQKLQERSGYFEALELGEVEIPDRPYLRGLIDNRLFFYIETLAAHQLQEAIGTASYFDFRTELKILIDEFLWRIGVNRQTLGRYLQEAGTERYVIYRSLWRRSVHPPRGHYLHREANLYSIRRDIEPRALRDALVSVYPKPFVGTAVGIRTRSEDSLSIAYYGNLRLAKWYYKRHGHLGSRFAQNTVSIECLRYAQEVGTDIAKLPIHTSSLECERVLQDAGALFDSRDGYNISIGVAIYRSDLKALERLFEQNPCDFTWRLYDLVFDIDVYRFMIRRSILEVVKGSINVASRNLGIPAIDAVLECGIPITDPSLRDTLYSSPEVVAHLYGLGVRWEGEIGAYKVRLMNMDVIEKLTELGHRWDPVITLVMAENGDPSRFRYFNAVAPLTVERVFELMRDCDNIRCIEVAHKEGCAHLVKGNLPPRPSDISKSCLDYIHEQIDPDY